MQVNQLSQGYLSRMEGPAFPRPYISFRRGRIFVSVLAKKFLNIIRAPSFRSQFLSGGPGHCGGLCLNVQLEKFAEKRTLLKIYDLWRTPKVVSRVTAFCPYQKKAFLGHKSQGKHLSYRTRMIIFYSLKTLSKMSRHFFGNFVLVHEMAHNRGGVLIKKYSSPGLLHK